MCRVSVGEKEWWSTNIKANRTITGSEPALALRGAHTLSCKQSSGSPTSENYGKKKKKTHRGEALTRLGTGDETAALGLHACRAEFFRFLSAVSARACRASVAALRQMLRNRACDLPVRWPGTSPCTARLAESATDRAAAWRMAGLSSSQPHRRATSCRSRSRCQTGA